MRDLDTKIQQMKENAKYLLAIRQTVPQQKEEITNKRAYINNEIQSYEMLHIISMIEDEYYKYKLIKKRPSRQGFFKKSSKSSTSFQDYVQFKKDNSFIQVALKEAGSVVHTAAMERKRERDITRIEQKYEKDPVFVPNTKLRPYQQKMYQKLDKDFIPKIGQFAKLEPTPYPTKPT